MRSIFSRLALSALCAAGLLCSSAQAATVENWAWLKGTTWYVPKDGLLALASNPSRALPLPVFDQTVYTIQGYRAGYFWGLTAVKYQRPGETSSSAPSCLQLVGSVTPEGQLHLTFTPVSSDGTKKPAEATTGIGAMTKKAGVWTMENQMATQPVPAVLLTHWAYMRQCAKGDACDTGLPGVGGTAEDFLKPCR